MTVNRGPGVAKNGAVGVTTLEHRLQLAGQYAENAPGVPRSGILHQAASVLVAARGDMSYDIGPCSAVISRTAAEGVYTPTLTGTTNVPTDDAPATNSRWDLIYLKQNDMAKGDADNQAVVGVIKGTAAASPTKPTASLPSGAMVLAEARIFALTTATNGGSNTVSQVWRHTAMRGAPVPIRNTAERDEITAPANGQRALRLDLAARPVETYDGAAWNLPPLGQIAVATYPDGTGNIAANFLAIIADVVTPSLPAGRKLRITLETDAYMSASSGICAIGLKQGGTSGSDNGSQIRNSAVAYQSATSTQSSDLTYHYTTTTPGAQRFYATSKAVAPGGATINYPENARRITVYDDGAA